MNHSDEKEKKADDGTTPVADYKGQGFYLVDGDKSEPIVKKNEAEIKKRAIAYMKDKYKTNVKVNNVVPARDAAVVMVEAEEPIQFHTSVIVGFDMQKKELDPLPNVWSEEGEVEGAIVGGLYAKAYKQEFEKLDTFTKMIAENNGLQGYNNLTIEKTHANGYEKSNFFITTSIDFKKTYEAYLANTNITEDKLRALFLTEDPKFEHTHMVCNFFTKKDKLPPNEEVEKIGSKIKRNSALPKGKYDIVIYKNFIVNRVGLPNGDNISVEDIQK